MAKSFQTAKSNFRQKLLYLGCRCKHKATRAIPEYAYNSSGWTDDLEIMRCTPDKPNKVNLDKRTQNIMHNSCC